jgi:signal transduction histidine kinase
MVGDMRRFAWVWSVIALCAVLGIAAMTVMTRHVMRLEQETRTARLRADHADKVRLALWRMETEANAMLLLENTRGTSGFLQVTADQKPEYVRQYFQIEAGAVRVMESADKEDADRLQSILMSPNLSAATAMNNCQAVHAVANAWVANSVAWGPPVVAAEPVQQMQQIEKGKRQEAVERTYNSIKSPNISQSTPIDGSSLMMIAGNHRALWLGEELFLVRQVLGANLPTMQGVWLRTDVLKKRLLDVARDLFPQADLAAISQEGTSGSDAMALVSLPWRLEVKEVIDVSPIYHSPAMTAMRFAWGGLALAFVAGSVLVIGLVRLSERRAAFVSSVTHELRTPLTTFQLYTELLANGMVRDEGKRQSYFETLQRESDRLGHLVENVLAFAQVERGSARGGVRSMEWREFWPSIIERMKTRLEQAGLTLTLVMEPQAQDRTWRVDPAALEHILLNLADNAVKYAQPREKDEVVLTCRNDGRGWEISLRDYGPGIAMGERRKIFRAFHKSAQAAAMSKPGVGLGLSLSKRLAKSMGAELLYREAEGGGACFVLRGGALKGPSH